MEHFVRSILHFPSPSPPQELTIFCSFDLQKGINGLKHIEKYGAEHHLLSAWSWVLSANIALITTLLVCC